MIKIMITLSFTFEYNDINYKNILIYCDSWKEDSHKIFEFLLLEYVKQYDKLIVLI